MANIIIWGIQSTVDRMFLIGDNLGRVLLDWIRQGILTSSRDCEDIFQSVAQRGLEVDLNMGLESDPETAAQLGRARQYLLDKRYPEHAQIRGIPRYRLCKAINSPQVIRREDCLLFST